jgi:uncharacterized protein YbaP (TraB family)
MFPSISAGNLCRGIAIVAACLFISSLSTTAAEPGGKHFLWRVNNAPQPFYILGSFHALRGSDYPLGSVIDSAIGECKRFVFEFDFQHADEAGFDYQMRKAAAYPRGTTLKQKVQPQTYAYVQKIAKIRASEYDHLKPWVIAYMVGNPLFGGIRSYFGVEGYALRKSGSHDIWGLETVKEHINVLAEMTDVEGEVFLLQTFVYGEREGQHFPEAVAAWKSGETERLHQMGAAKDREAPFLTWRLIDHRNQNWIPKIETAIKEGQKPTMVIVGARHLCGPHNVISLLQARGYKLEQL